MQPFSPILSSLSLTTDEQNKNAKLSTIDLLTWTQETACGMEYLAYKRVIHADIAARNVLIDSNNTAKIGDFGL